MMVKSSKSFFLIKKNFQISIVGFLLDQKKSHSYLKNNIFVDLIFIKVLYLFLDR